MAPDPLDPLRLALEVSPENLPLRRHLADLLLAHGRLDEAETTYRDGLGAAPTDRSLRLGLASTFFRQGNYDQALVLVETLLDGPEPDPAALLLAARLLLVVGEHDQALARYRAAVALDPALADEDLTERLGVATPAWPVPAPSLDGPVERPAITFADVGGMEPVKEEIRVKVMHPIAHPELYRAYGKPIGGGILLYGPPGCGKTHLARATAGEAGAGFIAVGIDRVLDLWLGASERNLHALFEQARTSRPCVLFFDEVDALGASRADLRASAGRQLVNQFLAELDGVEHANEGVLVLAATNAPWYLDPAFRRPGRFDRVLFVPPPDAPARAAILRILCRDKPTVDLDFDDLAARTAGLSGADLKAVVDLAVEARLREAIAAGRPQPLTARDLKAAARRVRPSTREWFANARNYAVYANQGGLYDDLLPYLEGAMSAAAEHAQALIDRSRWDLAERALEAALADDPDDPAAQALLALCLARRGQTRQARKVAAEALRLEPDLAFAHAVMASVLLRLDEGRKAEAAAREAIRLDPFEPAHQALLAQVHLQRRAWARALEAAERGLALDPRHAASATARTAALLQLGRREEAGAAIGATLARDPSDASAHTAQGWARLHAGDAPAALADFREALRLDPTLEPARDGLFNALKAKHPVYRLLLRALLWASRLGPRAHWVVFGGAFIWLNSLQSIARDFPGSRPLLLPLALGYLLFVVSLWAAEPLSTVLLATSRDGRLLLGPRERTAAALLAGIIATTAVVAAAGILAGSTPLFFAGVMLLGLIFPAMALVTAAPGRGRVLLGAAFGALCLVAAAGFALLLAGRGGAAWWPFGVVGLAGMLMAVAHPALMVDGLRAIR